MQSFEFRKLYFVLSFRSYGHYMVKVYNKYGTNIVDSFITTNSIAFDHCNDLNDFGQYSATGTATEARRKQADARRAIYNEYARNR